MNIAYQGIEGSYIESCAKEIYPDCKTIPCKTLDEVFEFLNVSTFKIKNKGKVNIGKYPPMNSKLRKELSDYFYL